MDWQGIVATVAPWIGTALGGPFGGMAVSAIGDALGISGATQDNIKKALSGATPEQMLALKEADQQFQVLMAKMGYEHIEALEKVAGDDRNSARGREMAIRDKTPMILAYGVTVGFFGVLLMIMFHAVPDDSRDVMNIMLGALGSAWTAIMAYYFGSSASSNRKTELIAQAQPVKP